MMGNDCSHDTEVCYQDVVVAYETDSDTLAEIRSSAKKIVKGKSWKWKKIGAGFNGARTKVFYMHYVLRGIEPCADVVLIYLLNRNFGKNVREREEVKEM